MKMETQERICGLCLYICDDFKIIEGDMKNVLDVVLPKKDLATIQELVMCTDCTAMLMNCFDFKTTCFYAHDYIVQLVNGKDDVKVDLKDAYLRKNGNNTGVAEDEDICGFCMDRVKSDSAMSLDVEEGVLTLKEMIKQCLPELDLSIIKEPVICPPCHGSLENCFRFVTNYLIAEEKIKERSESLDINSMDQIEMSSLLQFTARDLTVNEMDGNSVDTIKVDDQFCDERENGKERKISNESYIFKLEQMSCEEENLAEQKFLVTEEIEIKTEEDFNGFDCAADLPRPEFTTSLCVKLERLIPNPEGDRSIPCIENISTKYKEDPRNHCRRQRKSSKIPGDQSNQSNNKYLFESHSRVHMDPSEVTMFKCDTCSFQTKRKYSLKMHLLLHKNYSEVLVLKCETCSYQTGRKEYLKRHLLRHKDPSEVTMHKCNTCSYETRYKGHLKVHLLLHKDPSDLTMHKCNTCSYQTGRKDYLQKHLLLHKNPSEVTMHHCNTCSYQTRRKDYFKNHLLVHKDLSEVTTYKCPFCAYRAKRKDVLKRHLLVHKGPLEVPTYKCDSCSYQARDKSLLRRHLLLHKDPSDVTMHKCDTCSYQTRRKYELKTHLLRHKGLSEVSVYKCYSCSFQTKYKRVLKQHFLLHKGPSEVTMHKCNTCSYQTKYKYALKGHQLRHKDPSEVIHK